MNRRVLDINGVYTLNPFIEPHTIYVITADIVVLVSEDESLEIGNDCILKFEGGSVTLQTTGDHLAHISTSRTRIVAPNYHILKNCLLSDGFANSFLPVEWFGAAGDGVTDDSNAINRAIDSCHGCTVLFSNATYGISNSIIVKRNHVNIKCYGTIKITSPDVTAFDIATSESIINVNKLIGWYDTDEEYRRVNFRGIAIKLSDNCHNSEFNLNSVNYFDKGILLMPRKATRDYSGIQYCTFSFSHIRANYGICINLVSDTEQDFGKDLWVNENRFNGGRLQGTYGIYVVPASDHDHAKWDWINGNVFNCIGFEDIVLPIHLYHCSFCSFHDLRMSENIDEQTAKELRTYASLSHCKFLSFDIKSYFRRKYLKADHCHYIEFKRCFTDINFGDRQDYSRLLVLNEAGSAMTGATYKFLSSAITSRNDCKHLYFGNDTKDFSDCVIPYHELFPKLDNLNDTRILSSQCQIEIQDQFEVTITFDNSLSHIHPELIIHLKNGGNQGKLIFDVTDPTVLINSSVGYPVKVVGQADGINYVQQSGSYRVCYDHNNKLYVIPFAS